MQLEPHKLYLAGSTPAPATQKGFGSNPNYVAFPRAFMRWYSDITCRWPFRIFSVQVAERLKAPDCKSGIQ